VEQLVARRAYNPEVVSSNLTLQLDGGQSPVDCNGPENRRAVRLREFALDSVFTIIDIREKLIVNSKLKQRNNMELILIILVVLILFGGGGYWYTRRR
jgi:hypothetical protein